MLYPLQMFCCGCKLSTGAYTILVCHLLLCSAYVGSVTASLIFRQPSIASIWSPTEQLVNCGFGLIGIPVIICAIYGLLMRLEINVRLYLYYLLANCAADCFRLVHTFLFQDQCGKQAYGVYEVLGTMNQVLGEAFLCGVMRIASYVIVSGGIMLEAYCLWVIWSVCEDMSFGNWGPELAGLLPSKADMITKLRRPQDGPYADIIGLAHAKVPGPYPSVGGYDAVCTIGMPGQGSIFGGTAHEMNYPPSKDRAAF